MKAIIFCRTEAKGKHTFYVKTREDTYYLFQQDYRKTNNEYFKNGVSITDINNYGGVHSTSVRKTLDKLPIFIRYVEKEYGVAIYEKTKLKQEKVKNGKLTKVELL